MSMSAQYHAREWAKGKTAAAITQRIAALKAAPEWQGVEFDDVRVRHMRQTEIDTLTAIVADMPVEPPAPTTTKVTAADGTALTVLTHVNGMGIVVVRVFRDDELRHASPFMRGEFVAASVYVAETATVGGR